MKLLRVFSPPYFNILRLPLIPIIKRNHEILVRHLHFFVHRVDISGRVSIGFATALRIVLSVLLLVAVGEGPSPPFFFDVIDRNIVLFNHSFDAYLYDSIITYYLILIRYSFRDDKVVLVNQLRVLQLLLGSAEVEVFEDISQVEVKHPVIDCVSILVVDHHYLAGRALQAVFAEYGDPVWLLAVDFLDVEVEERSGDAARAFWPGQPVNIKNKQIVALLRRVVPLDGALKHNEPATESYIALRALHQIISFERLVSRLEAILLQSFLGLSHYARHHHSDDRP